MQINHDGSPAKGFSFGYRINLPNEDSDKRPGPGAYTPIETSFISSHSKRHSPPTSSSSTKRYLLTNASALLPGPQDYDPIYEPKNVPMIKIGTGPRLLTDKSRDGIPGPADSEFGEGA